MAKPIPLEEEPTAAQQPTEKPGDEQSTGLERFDLPKRERLENGVPDWVMIPPDLRFPRNKQAVFLRFRSDWTDCPAIGHTMKDDDGQTLKRLDDPTREQLWRQVIIWPINVADKRLAISRAQGSEERLMDELAYQMIRAIDGQVVDPTRAGIAEQFWNQAGERCRRLLRMMYHRLHSLDVEQTKDFLVNCIVVRSAADDS